MLLLDGFRFTNQTAGATGTRVHQINFSGSQVLLLRSEPSLSHVFKGLDAYFILFYEAILTTDLC